MTPGKKNIFVAISLDSCAVNGPIPVFSFFGVGERGRKVGVFFHLHICV